MASTSRAGHAVNVLDRRLSLGVGVGPYLYWDTVLGATRPSIRISTAWVPCSARQPTGTPIARFIIQGKVNYVVTANSINTLSATIGLGYQLDKPATPGPLTGASPAPVQDLKNEVTFFGGRTVTNAGKDDATVAESIQYRPQSRAPHRLDDRVARRAPPCFAHRPCHRDLGRQDVPR